MKIARLTFLMIMSTITLFVVGCTRNGSSPTDISGSGAESEPELRYDDQGCTIDLASGLKTTCGYTGKDHNLLTSGLRRIGLTLCSEHFALGSDARQAVEGMISHQNSIPGTSIRLYVKGTEAHTGYAGTLDDDGVFKVDFVDVDDCDAPDCSFSGRCLPQTDGSGRIDEFDLAFNDAVAWNFGLADAWDVDTGESSFRAVFLHEVNHGFGFPHVLDATSDLSTMGSKTGKWVGQKRNGLKAYDYGHLRHHYPYGSSPQPDLVLSNYTTEWSSSLSNWQCDLTEGLSRTFMFGSGSLDVSYTQMNRGGSFSDAYTTKIYLSRNESLGSEDVLLSSVIQATTGSWPAYDTELKTRSVTIPSDTVRGIYWVIVKVDANDSVDESKDDNNVLTIHESLTVAPRVKIARD